MLLIAGLGNPGAKYEKTRHNVGFHVVDMLCKRWDLTAHAGRFEAESCKGSVYGQQVLLTKPQTFMNLSGASIAPAANFYKIAPAKDLIVIHDDLDLPLGHLRLRQGGGAGGHRGVQSIIEHLGANDFIRVRVGIGRPPAHMAVDDYVVAPFSHEESAVIKEAIHRAADAVEAIVKDGLIKAMNVYNQ